MHVFTAAKQEGRLDYRGVTVHRVLPVYDARMILDHADETGLLAVELIASALGARIL